MAYSQEKFSRHKYNIQEIIQARYNHYNMRFRDRSQNIFDCLSLCDHMESPEDIRRVVAELLAAISTLTTPAAVFLKNYLTAIKASDVASDRHILRVQASMPERFDSYAGSYIFVRTADGTQPRLVYIRKDGKREDICMIDWHRFGDEPELLDSRGDHTVYLTDVQFHRLIQTNGGAAVLGTNDPRFNILTDCAMQLAGLDPAIYFHPDSTQAGAAAAPSPGDTTFSKQVFRQHQEKIIALLDANADTFSSLQINRTADNFYDLLCLGGLPCDRLKGVALRLIARFHPDKLSGADEETQMIRNYLTAVRNALDAERVNCAMQLAGLNPRAYVQPVAPAVASPVHAAAPTPAPAPVNPMTESLARKKMTKDELERLYGLGRRDFANANLSRLFLFGIDLRGADLRHANLEMTNLAGANLQNAKLTGPQLIYFASRSIQFCGIDLRETDLTGQNLDGVVFLGFQMGRDQMKQLVAAGRTDFSGMDITELDLTAAELARISLLGVKLNGNHMQLLVKAGRTDFAGLDLSRADLSNLKGKMRAVARTQKGISLSGVKLGGDQVRQLLQLKKTKIHFSEVNLSDARNLAGIDFTEIDLTGAVFGTAPLTGVKLNADQIRMLLEQGRTDLTELDLSKAGDLTGINLTGTILTGVILGPTSLAGVTLGVAGLQALLVVKPNLDLSGIHLEDAPLTGIQLNRRQFQQIVDAGHTHFEGLDLRAVDMHGFALKADASLAGVKLGGDQIAQLYLKGHRNFNGVDLTDTDLRGLRLSGASLVSVKLNSNQVRMLLKARHLDFTGVDLSHADLRGLDLRSVNLTSANVTGANLAGAVLGLDQILQIFQSGRIDFAGVDLRKATFTENNLVGISLAGAKLDRPQLQQLIAAGRTDFSGVDLSAEMSFAGIDFIGIDVRNMGIRGQSLSGAKLTGEQVLWFLSQGRTDFKGVDLTSANLGELNLAALSLEGVKLGKNQFQQLKEAGRMDFGCADLTEANLCGISLDGLDFQQVNLQGNALAGASLVGLKLGVMQIEQLKNAGRTDFSGIVVSGVDFSRTNLEGARFTGVQLTGNQFEQLYERGFRNFVGAHFRGNQLTGVQVEALYGTGFRDFEGLDFAAVSLTTHQVGMLYDSGFRNFKAADLSQVDFTGLPLPEASLAGVTLSQVQFDQLCAAGRANFDEMNLSGLTLLPNHQVPGQLDEGVALPPPLPRALVIQGATLTCAQVLELYANGQRNFQGADLRQVDFREMNLIEIDLRGARLEGAKFDGSTLTGAQFQGAMFDSQTSFSNTSKLTGARFFDPESTLTMSVPVWLTLGGVNAFLKNSTIMIGQDAPAIISPALITMFCDAYRADRKEQNPWTWRLRSNFAKKIEKLASNPAKQSLVLMEHFLRKQQKNPKARTVRVLKAMQPRLAPAAAT